MRIHLRLVALLVLSSPLRLAAQQGLAATTNCPVTPPPSAPTDSVAEYVWHLPALRCRVQGVADALSDTAQTTYSMTIAGRTPADSLRPVLYRLASFYQQWGDTTEKIVDAALAGRLRWLTFTTQPDGYGLSGTITAVNRAYAASRVEADMIEDLVAGLYGGDPDFDLLEWHRRWEAAGRSRHEVDH